MKETNMSGTEDFEELTAKLSRCHEAIQTVISYLQTPLGVLYKSNSDWKGGVHYLEKAITTLEQVLKERKG